MGPGHTDWSSEYLELHQTALDRLDPAEGPIAWPFSHWPVSGVLCRRIPYTYRSPMHPVPRPRRQKLQKFQKGISPPSSNSSPTNQPPASLRCYTLSLLTHTHSNPQPTQLKTLHPHSTERHLMHLNTAWPFPQHSLSSLPQVHSTSSAVIHCFP